MPDAGNAPATVGLDRAESYPLYKNEEGINRLLTADSS